MTSQHGIDNAYDTIERPTICWSQKHLVYHTRPRDLRPSGRIANPMVIAQSPQSNMLKKTLFFGLLDNSWRFLGPVPQARLLQFRCQVWKEGLAHGDCYPLVRPCTQLCRAVYPYADPSQPCMAHCPVFGFDSPVDVLSNAPKLVVLKEEIGARPPNQCPLQSTKTCRAQEKMRAHLLKYSRRS